MAFSGTILILSCVVEADRLSAGFLAALIESRPGLTRVAEGNEQGVEWIALSTSSSQGAPSEPRYGC